MLASAGHVVGPKVLDGQLLVVFPGFANLHARRGRADRKLDRLRPEPPRPRTISRRDFLITDRHLPEEILYELKLGIYIRSPCI